MIIEGPYEKYYWFDTYAGKKTEMIPGSTDAAVAAKKKTLLYTLGEDKKVSEEEVVRDSSYSLFVENLQDEV